MGKPQEDGVGNGQAAWAALREKYDGNTKEARREFHDKLHNTTMQSGDNPEDFLFVMDGYRDRLETMGQPVLDERYEGIILRALSAEYDRVRIASCERRDLICRTSDTWSAPCMLTTFHNRTPPTQLQAEGLPCRLVDGMMAVNETK